MLILILKFCMVTWLLNNIFMILLQHFQNLLHECFQGTEHQVYINYNV